MENELLIWKDFEEKNTDFMTEEPAMERFNETRFKRLYTVYKLSHLTSRIVKLDKKFQLPFNSILHVLDDISHSPENHSDFPDVDNIELIKRESARKFVLHIRAPEVDGPVPINDKYIFKTGGLPSNLLKFRSIAGPRFKYANDIAHLPASKDPLIIINHDPLCRTVVYGRAREYRRFNIIFSSILNTCDKLKDLNKTQFILIPWDSEVFPRSMFYKSRLKLDITTIKRPDSFHYLVMMHLSNWMLQEAVTSYFSKLDDKLLDQLYFILQMEDNYLFFNLNIIKKYNESNRSYVRFINQLNFLSLLGKHEDEVSKYVEKVKVDSDEGITEVVQIKSPENKEIPEEEHHEKIIDKISSSIAKVSKHFIPEALLRRSNNGIKAVTPVSTKLPDQSVIETVVQEKQVTQVIKNIVQSPSTTKVKEFNETDKYSSEWVEYLDREAEAFIENDENLSPAAKTRFKRIAKKYKDCMIDGVRLEDLLNMDDLSLSDSALDEKKLGFIPDKSALESTVAVFEKDYLKKTYRKHIASVITSFQKNGLYVVDIKQRKELSTLHNYTEFSVKFEDINSNTSTIKFRIPNINSDDRFITDGKPYVIKKQRCSLPIVKLSPTIVALCSNYNKTRVIRNTSKSHSFIEYISSLVENKSRSTASIVYGSLRLNEPISFDYTELAQRFKHITFSNSKGDKFHLTFDYYDRQKEFDGDEKLFIKLEATYGIYLGTMNNSYLFIDVNNIIRAYKKSGGEDTEFTLTSILDIIKESLQPGVSYKKNFSEYVVCQILNGKLPVIFILAYRYGLRNTLDYLKAPYAIVDNTSKEIVGEQFVIGNEDFKASSALDKVQFLDELKDANLDLSKIIIGASASLVAFGILDEPNKDLDIAIEDNYKKQLIDEGILVEQKENGVVHLVIRGTHIDAGVIGPNQKYFSYNNLKKLGTEKINGYTFISAGGMIEFYELCKKLFPNDNSKQKKYSDRIALIQKHCQNGTESINYTDKVNGNDPYGTDWIAPPTKEGDPVNEMTLYVKKNKSVFGNNEFCIRTIAVDISKGKLHAVTKRVDEFNDFTYSGITGKLPAVTASDMASKLGCDKQKLLKAKIVMVEDDYDIPVKVQKAKLYEPEITNYIPSAESFKDEIVGMEVTAAQKRARYTPKSNDIRIKFADRTLYINRYPLSTSLITAGLDQYDLTNYELAEMEEKDAYYRILVESGEKTNLLKGIDSIFDLFVDPITFQVLKSMHEPTTFRDLLIRAAVLLTTSEHKEPSSAANHRIRGYEQFPAMLYNEMSRSFASYQTKKNQKNNVFSINPQAVYLRIVQNQSTMPGEASNPVEDIKVASNITYAGVGGRDGESFVKVDVKMSKDDIGILSEATADSGKVGMNATASFNPRIQNTLGLIKPAENEDLKTLEPSQCLTIHSLLNPYATSDDAKRMNFISIQYSHMIPTLYHDNYRVRTGYERVIAHRTTKQFAGVAKGKGKVTKIDETCHLVEVTYDSGEVDLFPYGDEIVTAESVGIAQTLVLNVSLGQKVEEGDIITYDSSYFIKDHFTNQLDFTVGATANVAFIDNDVTNEDSFEISKEFAEKMTIFPVNTRVVTFSSKALIHKICQVGDEVTPSQYLMIFENEPLTDTPEEEDLETLMLMGDLNRSTPRVKNAGEIIQIDAYFGCEISEMSPTVAAVVKKAIAVKNHANKLAVASDNGAEYPPVTPIKAGDKFQGVTFDENTVMLVFHIKEKIPHGAGDKLVVGNQLKCTCASVFDERPYSESGVPIDLIFAQKAQNNRICLSPILMGIASRIMSRLEEMVVEEYFK